MEINRYEIKAGLKSPLCLAVVADLHSAPFLGVLEELKRIAPDAVLCPGDTLHRASLNEHGLDFLSASSKLFPTFCSLGNHEVKQGTGVREAMKSSGAVLLDNSWAEFREIAIGGLSTGYNEGIKQGRLKKTPRPELERLDGFFERECFKLLLSHHPEYYPHYLKAKKVDLVISGHAHGGQWRIFGRGIFAPGQGFFPKYTSELYDGRLLVSRGLSNHTWIPRIFNKTEIIVIDLK